MNYGALIGRAWQLTWRYKVLWIFGILLALAAGGGGTASSGGGNGGGMWSAPWSMLGTEEFLPVLASFMLLCCCALFFLIIVAVIVQYVARTALYRSVDQIEETSAGPTWREGFRLGWSNRALRMFLLDLIVGVAFAIAALVVVAAGAMPLLLLIIDNTVIRVFAVLATIGLESLIMLGLIVVGVIVSVLGQFWRREIALADRSVGEAFSGGVALARRGGGNIGIMWLLLTAIGVVFRAGDGHGLLWSGHSGLRRRRRTGIRPLRADRLAYAGGAGRRADLPADHHAAVGHHPRHLSRVRRQRVDAGLPRGGRQRDHGVGCCMTPPASMAVLTAAQQAVGAAPFDRAVFLEGPAGAGKTTAGVQRLLNLVQSGVAASSILVMTPVRPLARPYSEALRRTRLRPGSIPAMVTAGGLARRSVELFWPLVSQQAGFAQPDSPPVFLTLETAQYHMARIARPLLENGYFESVTIDRNRIYSQIIDNLNKAAVVGFPYTEIGRRLHEATMGDESQLRVYSDAQECATRFREHCLRHNLLDFSLQVEVFRQHLWPLPECRDYLVRSYRHLIVDNLEEDTPFAHDLLRDWLPQVDSALLIYDQEARLSPVSGCRPG